MRKTAVQVATIILAGGQGTRLHPLTLHHSKPAVSYGGRYRLIDIPISNSLNSDFRQIFVIAQYLSSELHHHIHQTYHFDAYHPGSVDVLTPEENEKGEKQWFTGTADAVKKNLATILKSPADYFLILSGDQLYNINFQQMVAFTNERQADLVIAALPVSEKEAVRFGLLELDGDHWITDFHEKPTDRQLLAKLRLPQHFLDKEKFPPKKGPQYLASMGIYVFRREALISLLEQNLGDDFGKHVIPAAVKSWKTGAFVYHGYWEDIGTISSYYEANLALTGMSGGLDTYDERNPIYTRPTFLPGPKIGDTNISQSIICEGSVIEAAEISHSIVGLRSHIGRGSVIRDTVMMGNHFYMPPSPREHPLVSKQGIGENCLIERTIIDEHVHIGNHVKLTNLQHLNYYDGDGIFIREGIIIVVAGAQIPDYFTL